MAWRRSDNKSLSETMMVKLDDLYMRHLASVNAVIFYRLKLLVEISVVYIFVQFESPSGYTMYMSFVWYFRVSFYPTCIVIFSCIYFDYVPCNHVFLYICISYWSDSRSSVSMCASQTFNQLPHTTCNLLCDSGQNLWIKLESADCRTVANHQIPF